ncbi:hypothetical protein GXW71_16645 [Roseomonas hellenica]|uniref:Uncharacterized protein n=1 Tax=Plastoroseomonas hellenica TaxID=2687306 RepID=A0ABS5F0C4_9PROT|nr:hypothetical protein [Plastoroseomonas hellenica]MBR0665990.1 hypothetical protein [Plastoroseomonas hellenica]
MAGTHVIIVGGISVNDPGGHDRFPYNFMNPAVARARKYGSNVLIIIFAPSYETRVEKQDKEHNSVTYTYSDTCLWGLFSAESCPALIRSKQRNPRHFLNVLSKAAGGGKFSVQEIRDKQGLTDKLKNLASIASIDYFGHSNPEYMFLEYSVSVSGSGTVTWGDADAAAVPAGKFEAGAGFISFGCNQGDPKGLAEQLRARWRIRTVGSNGKTDFAPIGRGEPQPSSALGYYEYPAAGGPPLKLTAPP